MFVNIFRFKIKKTPFPRNTFGWLLLILYTSKNLHHKAFITFLVNRKNTYVGYSSYAKNICWSIFSWDKFAKMKIGQSILRLTQKTLCLQKISLSDKVLFDKQYKFSLDLEETYFEINLSNICIKTCIKDSNNSFNQKTFGCKRHK